MKPLYFESDLHLAQFITEARHYSGNRLHRLPIPDRERRRRDYDEETDRLIAFIRGQNTAADERNTA
jgi:hypothetical protein